MKGAKASPPSSERADEPATLSPGVASLLRGANGESKSPSSHPGPSGLDSSAPPGRSRSRRLLRASLFLADLLLLTFAARLIFHAEGPLGLASIALGVVAVLLGAWLTCLALWLE